MQYVLVGLYMGDRVHRMGPRAYPYRQSRVLEGLNGLGAVGQGTLNRFFAAHVLVLPLLTAILMLSHFLFIRKQGISGPL